MSTWISRKAARRNLPASRQRLADTSSSTAAHSGVSSSEAFRRASSACA